MALAGFSIEENQYFAPMSDGSRARLTLDPVLQRRAERVLAELDGPYGAVVVVSVSDGRVLTLAGRSRWEPEKTASDLCLTPWAPSASVFKLVTAAALIEQGVRPETELCYHGGSQSVERDNLVANRRLDNVCHNFAFGLAKSQNALIARLAHEHLDPILVSEMARSFGFGEAVPFEAAVVPSKADIPSDDLAFARVAAGFWNTTLSPIHGAYLAATLARGGVTPPLRIIDEVTDGRERRRPEVPTTRRVLDEVTARKLAKMMVGTTEFGTARRSFRDPHGRPYLPGIAVAGKTGSLTLKQENPLLYSWFVGFAPAAKPEIAFAVLLGNGEGRYTRAHLPARQLLEGYFDDRRPIRLAAR